MEELREAWTEGWTEATTEGWMDDKEESERFRWFFPPPSEAIPRDAPS